MERSFCPSCGCAGETDPCAECGGAMIVDERFRLDEEVGSGRTAVSYRATDLSNGELVAVKSLDLSRVRDAKALELVERECTVLAQLRHPRIPQYVTHVRAGRGHGRRLLLVEGFVDGQDLEHELAGHRFTEAEILDVVGEVLDILGYLHGLSPPVIHRDIKPMNLVRERASGHLFLVDFGAVRDRTAGDFGGSTITGTFGYMAPEQFAGDAVPASDLFAVGALAIRLATRMEPHRLLDHANRFVWRDHAALTAPTANFIERLVSPRLDDRIASVAEARAALARASGKDEPVAVPTAELEIPDFGEAELLALRERLASGTPTAGGKGLGRKALPSLEDGKEHLRIIAFGLSFWILFGAMLWFGFLKDVTAEANVPPATTVQPIAASSR